MNIQRGCNLYLGNILHDTIMVIESSCCKATRGVFRGGGGARPPLGEWRGGRRPSLRQASKSKNTTKSLKSGLKSRLERLKNRKFSYPGEGDTPSPGPYPQASGRDSSPRAPLGKPSEYAPESDPVKVEGLRYLYHEEGRNKQKLKRHYDYDE